MVTILRNIIRACYDKTFYQQSEGDSFGRRFAHLYVLFVMVMLVVSLRLANYYITNQKDIQNFPRKVSTYITSLYPKELVLRFDKDKLSINQPMPYVVGDMLNWDSNENNTMRPKAKKNFITIDTTASIDDFTKYDTVVLAMENGIATKQSDNNEVRYYPYAEFLEKVPQPLTFDYISYNQIVNKIRPYINQIPQILLYGLFIFVILFVLVGPLFMVSGVLFNLLFLTILAYLIALAIKRKHPYGYIYKLGMYTAIPVIIMQQVAGLVRFSGLNTVWWLIALLILVVCIPPAGGALAKASDAPGSPMDPPKVV